MPNDTSEKSVASPNLRSRFWRSKWIDRALGVGIGGLIVLNIGSPIVREVRLTTLIEQSLQRYGDTDNDGFVTRVERDEFQKNFAKRYGLTYVSGFPYKYSDGRQVPYEDLIKVLEEYIGILSKQ